MSKITTQWVYLLSFLFAPSTRKDYSTNRLSSGLLQLSSSTYLLLDEIHLQPGQLNHTGCLNVKALSSVVTSQRMNYDFQFYDGTFPTDIPILALSDTKSMLPVSDSQLVKYVLTMVTSMYHSKTS